ncbi:YkgJ family cysteine cluster protein [Pontibacter cellulosilyticus]|uniref:YkgJ family cysteine cluster protein n=1 Tax=Pontibacter cellulosilyticus TaxID=1720253 RepID=A0A923NAZ8_9BACT|nr:YkgJ family cysteine cluster protein [Pontibacter cellulosilyticus]MBC5994112.1 YkgJ family cysteine cluster protein [Pontibacter cellulosilyticus]
MVDSTNICLACGLCCTGTLIGFVQLNSEELPAVRELMDIEEATSDGVIIQPCNSYCDGCTIYSDRPKQCASYDCELLKSFDRKELDYTSAVSIVDVVKQKKSAIEEKLALLQIPLQSQSFYFKMSELKNLYLKNEHELSSTPDFEDLIADIKQLDSLLSEKFGVTVF